MNVRSEPSGTALPGTGPSGTGSSGTGVSGAGSSASLERRLLECHAMLRRLEESCEVPAVRAAVRAALAELRAALDSQAVDFPFFSPQEEADDPRPAEPGEPVAAGRTDGTVTGGYTVEYATEHAGAA
ncbi:DUF6052 family protein [Streptosporangium sp. NPDC050855]|uniref:DUF6052 family protein n=1 Tax=Streptosporangium sp. NPDC050855 TaxID=3366194 RepID=UPI00379EDB92